MPVRSGSFVVELREWTSVWYKHLARTMIGIFLASKTKRQRLLSWFPKGCHQFFHIEEFYLLECLQPCKLSQGSFLCVNNISTLPKVEKSLSQLILNRKTCYGHRDLTGNWNRHGYRDRPSFFLIFSDSNRVSDTRKAFQGSKELQSSKWRSSRLSFLGLGHFVA